MVHAKILPDRLAKWNPRQTGNSRFHTVCRRFREDSDGPFFLLSATTWNSCIHEDERASLGQVLSLIERDQQRRD
jgi:hypothetical protein